jgi:hypothetical protein
VRCNRSNETAHEMEARTSLTNQGDGMAVHETFRVSKNPKGLDGEQRAALLMKMGTSRRLDGRKPTGWAPLSELRQ